MVQIFNTSNPNSKISEMLGLSLGQGLSNGINSFYANRALDNVLNDKAISNGSFSERMGALQKALSPYGEVGQNILNQRLQVEAQAYQERQAKEQAKLAKEKEERKYEHERGLKQIEATNAQQLEGTKQTNRVDLQNVKHGQTQNLDENKFYRESQFQQGQQERRFEHETGLQTQKDVAAGERQTGLFGHQNKLQDIKFLQNKALAQFENELPLNALQESQKLLNDAKIKDLEQQNKYLGQIFNNSPDVKSGEFDKSGLPTISMIKDLPEDQLRLLSGLRGKSGANGILGNIAQNEIDIRLAEKKDIRQDKKDERQQFEADRKYHSEISRPIIQAANDRLKQSDVNKGIREDLSRNIASGDTSGFFPYMVDRLGLESFRNPASARFSSDVKNMFIGSINDIPGARPNIFLERKLSSAQPEIGRSVEANLTVMEIGNLAEDIKDEQARKELEIAKEDIDKLGYARDDISIRAREAMGDYVNRRQEEAAMNIQKIHEDTLDDASLINELMGGKVTPGTYVTPRMMKILYLKNSKDMGKAIEDVKKYGLKLPEFLE